MAGIICFRKPRWMISDVWSGKLWCTWTKPRLFLLCAIGVLIIKCGPVVRFIRMYLIQIRLQVCLALRCLDRVWVCFGFLRTGLDLSAGVWQVYQFHPCWLQMLKIPDIKANKGTKAWLLTGPFILIILARRTTGLFVALIWQNLHWVYQLLFFNVTKFSCHLRTLVNHRDQGPSGKWNPPGLMWSAPHLLLRSLHMFAQCSSRYRKSKLMQEAFKEHHGQQNQLCLSNVCTCSLYNKNGNNDKIWIIIIIQTTEKT